MNRNLQTGSAFKTREIPRPFVPTADAFDQTIYRKSHTACMQISCGYLAVLYEPGPCSRHCRRLNENFYNRVTPNGRGDWREGTDQDATSRSNV